MQAYLGKLWPQTFSFANLKANIFKEHSNSLSKKSSFVSQPNIDYSINSGRKTPKYAQNNNRGNIEENKTEATTSFNEKIVPTEPTSASPQPTAETNCEKND